MGTTMTKEEVTHAVRMTRSDKISRTRWNFSRKTN